MTFYPNLSSRRRLPKTRHQAWVKRTAWLTLFTAPFYFFLLSFSITCHVLGFGENERTDSVRAPRTLANDTQCATTLGVTHSHGELPCEDNRDLDLGVSDGAERVVQPLSPGVLAPAGFGAHVDSISLTRPQATLSARPSRVMLYQKTSRLLI